MRHRVDLFYCPGPFAFYLTVDQPLYIVPELLYLSQHYSKYSYLLEMAAGLPVPREAFTSLHRQLAATIAASLLASSSSPATLAPLGLVTFAERAYVGESVVSVGSSIYPGDRMSTDADGTLRVHLPALTLQLNEQTSLTVRPPDKDDDVEADLTAGTLVFSSAQTGRIVVMANRAMIRPAAAVPTIAQIRVVGPRELRVYAQRGPVEFFYSGESEVIASGTACRLLLDPSARELAMAGESAGVRPDRKKPGHSRATFLVLAVGAAAGIAIPLAMHDKESPDHPGHGHKPPKKPGD